MTIYDGNDIANNLDILGCSAIYNNYTLTPTHIVYSFDYKNYNHITKLKLAVRKLSAFMKKDIDIVDVKDGNFGLQFTRNKREFVDFSDGNLEIDGVKHTIILGKNADGGFEKLHLDDAPHLLVAGATGSGKSVFINNLILNLVYNNSTDDLGLIMIDPKKVELAPYKNLSHLVLPIANSVNDAIIALNSLTAEMDNRYSILNSKGLRDNSTGVFRKLVLIIDELSDLMMANKNAIEYPLIRLAQMGRACGIHLVVATQRPTVNVVTGLLKANIPTRIAFSMGSMRDSMVLLDYKGAERLLGKGDCLVKLPANLNTIRLQAPFISTDEVYRITRNLVPRVWSNNTSVKKNNVIDKIKSRFKNYIIKELNDYDTFED